MLLSHFEVLVGIEAETFPTWVSKSTRSLLIITQVKPQSSLLIWSQLHGIVSLKNTGGIKAAVTYQNWPQTCALVHDQDVKRLIKNHVDNTVQSIMNAQYNDSHH